MSPPTATPRQTMQQCQTITRQSGSNLAMAFILLPRPRREAMAALYAFCREVDDVADDESVPAEKRRATLAAWREDIRAACHGGQPAFAVNQELQPVIARYALPFDLFEDLIRGVEMDLDIRRYETCQDLEQYTYRVASVVGLLSIEIFGHRHPACRDYAVSLGHALQLTNILRDVHTDAGLGRIYLPLAELKRFGVSPEEILRGEYSDRYRALAESMAEKARAHYRKARASLPPEDRKSMVAAELMGSVYWGLLETLERRQFNVFTPGKVRLSKPGKLWLIFRTWARVISNSRRPNYGAPA